MRWIFRASVGSVLLVGVFLPPQILAQDPVGVTLQGTVLDATTELPLQGVRVAFTDIDLSVVTDAAGSFTLTNIPPGPHDLLLQRNGYEPTSGRLTVEQSREMTFSMNPVRTVTLAEMSRVQGSVRDADGNDPLESVEVSFLPLGITRATGSNGRFLFQNVPPGQYTMTLNLLGYSPREETVEVEEGKILTLDLTLSVEPIELDPIEVSVEARSVPLEDSGFYQRRQSTGGTFITRERIEERDPFQISDLFVGMAGVQVQGGLGMGTQDVVLLTGSRALSFRDDETEVCLPTVWVDGRIISQGGPVNLLYLDGSAFIDQLIDPEEVEGVEVYNSPTSTPVQYNVNAGCGVIVFWTRMGRRATSTSVSSGMAGGPYGMGEVWTYSSDPFPVDQGKEVRVYLSPDEMYSGTYSGFANDTIHVERILDTPIPLSSVSRLQVRKTRSGVIFAGTALGAGAGILIATQTDAGISGDHEIQGEMLDPIIGGMAGALVGALISWKVFGTTWQDVPLDSVRGIGGGNGGVPLTLRIPWSPGR